MRISGLVLIFGLSAATLAAQQDTSGNMYSSNPSTTTQQQQQQKPAGVGVSNASPEGSIPMGDTGERMRDRYFLKAAAQDSRASVKMSQLALAKSENDDVKAFAQKVMTDHAVLARTWKPVAQEMGAAPSRELSKKDEKLYEKLSSLSGEAFDKEYMVAMMENHRADLKQFQDTMNATANNSLRDALDRTIPVIQDHIAQAEQIARKNGYVAMK